MSTPSTVLSGLPRLLALVLLSLAAAIIAAAALAEWMGNGPTDFNTYWHAGDRLRHGGELYTAHGEGVNALVMYRYAPWLAWLFVPVSLVPREIAAVPWMLLCAAAGVYVLRPFAGQPSLLVLAPVSLSAVLLGNVALPMLAALLYLERRGYGPVGIALAASLKATPILLVLVYVGRGEWRKAALTVALTGLLVAPMLLYDLSEYAAAPHFTMSLAGYSTVAWIVVAGACAVAALLLARTRYAWLAASVAVLAALPRMLPYDVTYLVLADARPHR